MPKDITIYGLIYFLPAFTSSCACKGNFVHSSFSDVRHQNCCNCVTMKFDVQSLRYMSRDDFRVLVAVEMGMRNHELVPLELIAAIANIRGGGAHKIIGELLRNILIVHEKRMYDGFRLTTAGYDFLALRSLMQHGAITEVGRKIGVGKESDIFVVRNSDEVELALKLHRLGRRSFRNIIKVCYILSTLIVS